MNVIRDMKNVLHQFLYNPMIHECGWITISLHKTPEGAEQAKEAHKSMAYNDWLDEFQSEEEQQLNPFGKDQDWRTGKAVLLD